MTSKRTTYPLLAVALVVWGIIAYKLFSSEGPSAPSGEPGSGASAPPATAVRDTLRADYRDPFLGKLPEAPRKPSAAVVRPSAPRAPERAKTLIVWTGTLRKQERVYYLISLDGVPYMIRPGESAGGFTLSRVGADSVVLSQGPHSYTAKRP